MPNISVQLSEPRSSEITDETLYRNRRRFLTAISGAAAAWSLDLAWPRGIQSVLAKSLFSEPDKNDKLTPIEQVTTYNNFYEFGTDKDDPSKFAKNFKTKPWKMSVEGFVKKPRVYDLDELFRPFALEERIYRHRCVEGWSMVVPWLGFPLADLIKRLDPTSNAKFVEFTTLLDPQQMPGQKRDVLDWPYVEGLRMDEATNSLTLMVTGLYGKPLPNQDGAPIRLVVPWKYGFKSIKSIVKIKFVEKQPLTTWAKSAPTEYGFYSNVNPNVDHPRWSQRKERRLGEFFKRDTLIFNGYGDQVASLYTGMDLKKFF
ncbi:MAG TPA: protein-methionine-sulfoxide reductase catalytic subunit MsrP [Bdellovibrionota bacterium]|nr:protein-methionine-sulfoxide reductase catalytic subunit MsrP [Bdellovibrionota bacterium]